MKHVHAFAHELSMKIKCENCAVPGKIRWNGSGDKGRHGLSMNLLEHHEDLRALRYQLTFTTRSQLLGKKLPESTELLFIGCSKSLINKENKNCSGYIVGKKKRLKTK